VVIAADVIYEDTQIIPLIKTVVALLKGKCKDKDDDRDDDNHENSRCKRDG